MSEANGSELRNRTQNISNALEPHAKSGERKKCQREIGSLSSLQDDFFLLTRHKIRMKCG